MVSAGTEEHLVATVQYGRAPQYNYRVYGKARARDGQVFADGAGVLVAQVIPFGFLFVAQVPPLQYCMLPSQGVVALWSCWPVGIG